AGLSINSSTGLISGTPTAAGTSNVTVTASDATGASGSTSFTWTVTTGGGSGCGTTNLALGRTTTASSTENAGTPAVDATDGNTGTRWSSAFSDPQWLEVDLGSVHSICQVNLNWEAAYATAFQIQTSTDGTNWTSIYSTTAGNGGTQSLNVSGSGRYVRMYGTARATQYGYSLWEFQVFGSGTTSGCATTNLAQGRTTTASSTENAGTPAADATDGNTGTRWSSAFSDPQWLEVDLGATHSICGVTLNWETAYATAFQIQTSTDGTNWTSIYSTTAGTGGTQSLTVSGSGRYVRMYGTARATQYGYSLWEFQVYGS
ncbi:MAG TPA: discoidin domain-containing protein, partial [Pseudonocardiaceae bacterium]|nr:discoidin domain-containing protein [Pseudonocardiaceae bacterium]